MEINRLLSITLLFSLISIIVPSALECVSAANTNGQIPIYGLDFSPYVDGQDPSKPWTAHVSEDQLRTRMSIIAPYTSWIRTYGCSNGLENEGRIAHEMGLKVAVGAWLSDNLTTNEQEITNLTRIIKAHQADMVVVGSEVLRRNELSEEQLIGYINRVKEVVKEENLGIPVTTADTDEVLLAHLQLISAVDVVFVNYFPYWHGSQVDRALDDLDSRHQKVVKESGSKEVIVSETGWPSCGDQVGSAVPSPENSALYFKSFVSWAQAKNVPYFYFEAFDESWKAKLPPEGEGPQGACWGIWDKNGNLKPAFSSVNGAIPVYRMWSPSNTDHFYTTSYDEYSTTAVNYGYQQEGILGYLYDNPQTGTIPVYRMFSPYQLDHFYTTSYDEYSTTAVNYGYQQEGILGYMYSSNQPGSIPIYRMWSPSNTDHFYTTNYDEYSTTAVNYGYSQEGILGYAATPTA